MYLRTPKRYTRRGQQRPLISWRRLFFWILAPVVIFVGIGVYQNRERFIPGISQAIEGLYNEAREKLATQTAPTPAPTQDPRDVVAQANDAWRLGSIERAVALYQEVIDALPNDVTTHYRVTLGLIMMNRLDEALAAAEKTVNADPFSSDAWAIRAWALDWNGRPGDAIASALMALELNPDSARARAFLGEAYFSLDPANMTQRALDTVNEALELDPESFEAYRARGLITEYGLFDFETARQDFETAYDLAPNMLYIVVDLAQLVFQREGDTEGAVDLLREVVDRNPQNTLALLWLGIMYNQGLGNPSQAAEYLTRCVEYDPQNVSCYYNLGRVQFRLEQYTAAAESFETAVDLSEDSPIARHMWWAANAQVTLGSCSKALTYLRPGYELAKAGTDPDLVTAYEDLLQTCQVTVDAGTPTATPADG